MGLSLVTAPLTEPITLAEARASIRVEDNTQDGMLAGLIIAARDWAENDTSRRLMTQTWDETFDWRWPCDNEQFQLTYSPVQSITSITYVDDGGATQTLASNQYVLLKNRPYPLVQRAFGVEWPTVRYQRSTITVRYVCGYGNNPGDVPESIRQAMCQQIQLMFDQDPQSRETIEIIRESLISPSRIIRF